MHNPSGSQESGGKKQFPPRLSCFQLRVLLLLGRVTGAPRQGPPALMQWAPLVDVLVVSVLTVSRKGYALGYLGIHRISGEAQH